MKCPECDGEGHISSMTCLVCNGEKEVELEEAVRKLFEFTHNLSNAISNLSRHLGRANDRLDRLRNL